MSRLRPERSGFALVPTAVALAIDVATLLSVPPVPGFASPLYPAFVLLGAAGLLGVRRAVEALG